jgi:hypothetical protein
MVNTLKFENVLQQVNDLTYDEQLRLLVYVAEKARVTAPKRKVRRWREIEGVVTYPAFGEDAQNWVTRSRQESDNHRTQQWESRNDGR